MLTDSDYYEELLACEDDLIDEYLSGALPAGERADFESHFLSTPERVRKLRFARALQRYVADAADETEREGGRFSRALATFFRALAGSPARAAATAFVLLAVFGLLTWFVYFRRDAAFDRGLAAVQEAIQSRRPFEARMSGLAYTPWVVTRDGSGEAGDPAALERAERLLLNAADERPGPAADRALGKLYLAKKDYGRAVSMFESALKADERDARLHNDLGVALLEKGRVAGADSGEAGDIEALSRSVKEFGRALELDDTLNEARFNRALAYQQMRLRRQAVEGWKDYLQHDSTSLWADEAREKLKHLEESGRADTRGDGRGARDFLEAWHAGDEAAAWRAYSRSYNSSGNEVANALLDSLLGPDVAGAAPGGGEALPALAYLAGLDTARAGDQFLADVVGQYERAGASRRPLLAEARGHMKAGEARTAELKWGEAAGEFTSARLGYERAGDAAGRSLAEYRLAVCQIFLKEIGKARVAFEHLHAVCESRQYQWLAAQCLYRLAHVSIWADEYTKAIDYSARALAEFKRREDLDGELSCLSQLADVNQSLNRVERSLGYLRRGLALFDERGAQLSKQWEILAQIGFSLSSLGHNEAALLYQKEALSLAQESLTPLQVSRSHGYVGAACAALKMYAEAAAHATQALETGAAVTEETGRREMMANASLQLADVYRQSGDCAKALDAYDHSLGLYGELNDQYYTYASHKGRLLCLASGTDDQAIGEELRTTLALFDGYRGGITAETQRASFFDKEQGVYDFAIGFEASRANDPVKAFEYSEQSRARSLLDAVEHGAEVLRKVYGPDVALPATARSLSLTEVLAGLPEGSQVLQYAVLEDRLLLWVVSKTGVRQEQVGISAGRLTQEVRAYLAAVSHPPADEGDGGAARLGAELYRTLITPAEPYLDKSKYLCVVPDKALHYLPFGALVSPATGRYLLEDYTVGVAPSSTIFVGTSAAAAARGGATSPGAECVLSVGDPAYSPSAFPSLPALPGATREATAVSELYPKRRLLLRGTAGERQVKDEFMRADVAHLAAHYVVDEGSEMLSGFPLAPEAGGGAGRPGDDGFLQSYELYGLRLPRTRLVVLSACRTGIEQQYGGEGAVGATRPFLAAGVPLVVASLWPVDSESSAELMVSFHRHRTRDQAASADALRLAQTELARGPDRRRRHPFYWAAFVPVGGLTTF